MATRTSKQVTQNLNTTGLKENTALVTHLRSVAYNMVSHRSNIGVDAELDYDQKIIDNKLTQCDFNALDYEKKINQAIDGVTSGKRDDAISIYIDLIIGQLDKLFRLVPTPVPDLPKREEDIVVDKIEEVVQTATAQRVQEAILGYMETLVNQGIQVTQEEAVAALQESGFQFAPTEEEIFEIAKRMKGAATKLIRKRAVTGAKRMERRIHDIIVETNFGDEIIKFLHDFATYPYAVMRDGFDIPFTRKVWKNNKWVKEEQSIPFARRISPINFYWSSDSLEIDDGTAVGDVVYLRRAELEKMYRFEKNDSVKAALKEAITMCGLYDKHRNWLEHLGHEKETQCQEDSSMWPTGTTVPVFRIHTLLDACKMREMGMNPTGSLQQYEVEAWLLSDWIVRFNVYDPSGYDRPYNLEKFRHLPGRFEGKSLPKILEPLEHEVREVKRNELLNIGFSSAPITLRDVSAFDDEDELPDIVSPGDNYDVNSKVGANQKAIEFQLIPNITAQLRQVLFDLQAEADVKSQIPSLLTGGGNLGSNVRSASMLATQIGGASKNLKRQMWLIARNIIVPHVETLFEYEMLEGDDDRAKVDAAVNVGSIEALVNREFVLQNAQQLVQYLSPYAQSGQISNEVINQLLFTILSESGISTGDDPELIEEFDGLINESANALAPTQPSGVALDGRSDFQALTNGSLNG